MSHGCADAVCPRVTAAYNDHILVLGGNVIGIPEPGVEKALGTLEQELHGEVNAFELASRNG